MHSFLQHFGIYSFKIDFRILHNFRGVFRVISSIYDLQGSKYGALQPCFLIFFRFLCLDTRINIYTFCFSSENLQLLCPCDVIKNIIRFFINFQTICFILTIEIPNFHIFIRQRCEKAHFEKLQDGMQG